MLEDVWPPRLVTTARMLKPKGRWPTLSGSWWVIYRFWCSGGRDFATRLTGGFAGVSVLRRFITNCQQPISGYSKPIDRNNPSYQPPSEDPLHSYFCYQSLSHVKSTHWSLCWNWTHDIVMKWDDYVLSHTHILQKKPRASVSGRSRYPYIQTLSKLNKSCYNVVSIRCHVWLNLTGEARKSLEKKHIWGRDKTTGGIVCMWR